MWSAVCLKWKGILTGWFSWTGVLGEGTKRHLEMTHVKSGVYVCELERYINLLVFKIPCIIVYSLFIRKVRGVTLEGPTRYKRVKYRNKRSTNEKVQKQLQMDM